MKDTPFHHSPHRWATVGNGGRGDYRWLDFHSPIARAPGHDLPHWRQDGCVYFVTCRTADSIPSDLLAAWMSEREQWLAVHPFPHDEATAREYHEQFRVREERYLDEGHGACLFREASVRAVIVEILSARDGVEYSLDEFVVMPNHIHVLVAPSAACPLSEVLTDWKRVSAHRINRLVGRKGQLWQHEGWDHVVRDAGHLDKYRGYIQRNPAHLP